MQFVPFKLDIYPDNSRVFSLEDIGELPSTSSPPYSSTELGNVLVCRTDRSPCCAIQPNRFGEWTHNNMNVGTRGKNDDYFRTRDDVQHSILAAEPCTVVHVILESFVVNFLMLIVLHRCSVWR